MAIDIRTEAAKYYDLNPDVPKDLQFYRNRILSSDCEVLELGCGTGRVLVSLARYCAYIHGIDISEAMASICREKLKQAHVSITKASVQVGDITNLSLDRKFDLMIAPYRVFQNLETDAEIDGFFETVRRHLAPEGRCILNVFNPNRDVETLRREWVSPEEYKSWETIIGDERITCHGKNTRMDTVKMVLYPELIYRRYRGGSLVEEVVIKIVMRAYYANEFDQLIKEHGFEILRRWGGYHGESYGEGPELVIEFKHKR